MSGQDNTRLWFVAWGLLIGAALVLRFNFCEIASWPRDQAAFLWVAVTSMIDGSLPPVSMETSTGLYNPNGAVLAGIVLSWLPGGVMVMSMAMTALQIAGSLLAVAVLPGLRRTERFVLAALLLTNPFIIAYSIDFWMPWSVLTFGGVILALLVRLLHDTRLGFAGWATFWGLMLYFPCVYVGHVTFLLATAAVLIVLRLRGRIDWGRRFWQGLAAGAAVWTMLSVVPYFEYEPARERLDFLSDVSDNAVYDKYPRDVNYALRALTHPWRLMVDPRQFFWYSSIRIITPSTETGWWGSFRTVAYLTAAGILVALVGLGWHVWRRRPDDPLGSPITKVLATIYTLVLAFYWLLPAKMFHNESKGATYLLFLWILLALCWASLARRIRGGAALLLAGGMVLALNQAGLLHNLTRDHLRHPGPFVSWADVPLRDRAAAMEDIASRVAPATHARVGYDFFHGSRKTHEEETLFYAAGSVRGNLAAGRLYDAELWIRHGVLNLNDHLTERDHPDNRFLVTWSFVEPGDLRPEWRDVPYLDHGRVRVFDRDITER